MAALEPTPEYEAFLKELQACVGSTGKDLDAAILLAIASQFVGQLIAMQDQRVMTIQRAMAIVDVNIATGNVAAVDSLMVTRGRA